ncbi:MAG: hypothetical protein JW808_04245 [Victivallales bacterium]|nr:hypothetical protein [Victivallales bacterium]
MTAMLNQLLLVVVFVSFSLSMQAQTYPFSLPDSVEATLNINTHGTEPCKNRILGLNIFGYTSPDEKEFMRQMDPITVRFPHGVWANFYDWRTDGYQKDGFDNGNHETVLDTYIKHNMKCGIIGLSALNSEKKRKRGKGYDMVWTFNLNFDNDESSIARIKDRKSKGFEVKDIEMGNEHFWKTQRSNRTATPEDYVRHAKSLSAAIKQEFPDIRLSVPLSWRRNHAGYNKTIADGMDYYDAISIHRYAGADPDKPGNNNNAYSALLTARLTIHNDVDWIRKNYGPDKQVWLTEWGVSAGPDVHAAACLGMADFYLHMFENQHIYDRANWFSVNGVLNSFVTVVKPGRKPAYPLEKRGYLSIYEIVRGIFENGMLFNSDIQTEKLNTDLGPINAVSALAVLKDEKITVMAVNLTNKTAEFNIKMNNKDMPGEFVHQAMVFKNLGVVDVIPFGQSPLKNIEPVNGDIILPAFSVNKIAYKHK